MNVRHAFRPHLAGSLLSLALVGSGASAQSELHTEDLATPRVQVGSCAQVDILWNLELVEQYPQIPSACHEVVTNNGVKWARFEANFLRINRDGTVTSEFLDRRGRAIGRFTMIPGEGQQVILDGRKRPFSDLRQNQRISLYVPEGAATLVSEPMETSDATARVVDFEPASPEPVVESSTLIAEASPPPRMTRLPDTAGLLPWFAASALLSALAALGLRRRGR